MVARGEEILDALADPDRMQVLERLGAGSLGVVDRVFDARLGRVIARKTLTSERLERPASVRGFLNEVRILARLDHGSILPLFEAYLDGEGRPAYTMRELAGPTLAEVLGIDPGTGRAKPLELDRALTLVEQLADALAHAHERGVVHLDLKPENVFVLDYDRVVLTDWGAARIFDPERGAPRPGGADDPGLRVAAPPSGDEDDDVVIGTPRYMSPEQTVTRRSELDPASDVFSLGVVFYQMLTGQLPFQATTLERLLEEIRSERPVDLLALAPGLPPRIASLVLSMLEKREWERPESMRVVLEELRSLRSAGAQFLPRSLAAGEVLFREGEAADFAAVIVEGEIEIWSEAEGERRVLGRALAGETVGELALISGDDRSASATSLGSAEVRLISASDFQRELAKLSPWVLAMLTGVIERFVDRSDRLVELLRDSRGKGQN